MYAYRKIQLASTWCINYRGGVVSRKDSSSLGKLEIPLRRIMNVRLKANINKTVINMRLTWKKRVFALLFDIGGSDNDRSTRHGSIVRVVIFIVTLKRSLRSIKDRVRCVMSCCNDRPSLELMLKHRHTHNYSLIRSLALRQISIALSFAIFNF